MPVVDSTGKLIEVVSDPAVFGGQLPSAASNSSLIRGNRDAWVKLLPAPAREGLSGLEAPQFTTDKNLPFAEYSGEKKFFCVGCGSRFQLRRFGKAGHKKMDKTFALPNLHKQSPHLYSILIRRKCPLSDLKISGCI